MYTQCYRGISKDWDACASKFIALVREEMARKNVTIESRTVELCCAKHGFLRCVYLAGWLKCRKEEAIFISRMADTLSNIRVYSTRCASLDTNICTNSAKNTDPVSMPVVLSILIIWYILS
ncbi:hypothetical protein AAG570_006110 [Ranatra chinensis]|uniref:Uncharacterized protein n=1 Tax=Ranatra chinensis TaxID=642074 RepID=A0ABD0YKQ7_9HEMI